VVRASAKWHGEVMADLMGVGDLVRRAAEIDRLGVRYICLHTPTDLQGGGDAEAERQAVVGLRSVGDVLRNAAPAVAGGITAANARAIAGLRPELVVVGSGITRAPDPRAAAAAIRVALDEGEPR